jgi:hypothetical protein
MMAWLQQTRCEVFADGCGDVYGPRVQILLPKKRRRSSTGVLIFFPLCTVRPSVLSNVMHKAEQTGELQYNVYKKLKWLSQLKCQSFWEIFTVALRDGALFSSRSSNLMLGLSYKSSSTSSSNPPPPPLSLSHPSLSLSFPALSRP